MPNHRENWVTWKMLKRLRTGAGRTKRGLHTNPVLGKCGEEKGNFTPMSVYSMLLDVYYEDLMLAAPNNFEVAHYLVKII